MSHKRDARLIRVNQFESINACKHIIKSLSCLVLEFFKIVDRNIQPQDKQSSIIKFSYFSVLTSFKQLHNV